MEDLFRTKQKEYLEKLKDVAYAKAPIFTARNYLNGGKYTPGKQRFLGEQLPPIDHVSIVPNQVVWDIDATAKKTNAEIAQRIILSIKDHNMPFLLYDSGGKGFHIETFFSIDVQDPELARELSQLIKESKFSWKDIRQHVWEKIIEYAGYEKNLIGRGKTFDPQKVNFSDGLEGKGTLIRCVGGRKQKHNQHSGSSDATYKTHIVETELEKTRFDKVKEPESVAFPNEIPVYELPEQELRVIVEKCKQKPEFNSVKENKKFDVVKDIGYTGGMLNTPCVQKALEGRSEGQRAQGAQIISLALCVDKVPEEKARDILQYYVNNCKGTDQFTFSEAWQWYEWTRKQPEQFWTCKHSIKAGLCYKHVCNYWGKVNEDAFKLQEDPALLEKIDECFDMDGPTRVVGEYNNRKLVLLLYLTAKMGPEWCLQVVSKTSSGKSHLLKSVAALVFGEADKDFFVVSRITKSALNHMDEEAQKMKGKVLIIEELQGARDVVEQLRLIISEGFTTLYLPQEVIKPDGTREIKTVPKRVDLSNTLISTCNAEGDNDIDDDGQMSSRSWIINMDESPEQTESIVNYEIKRAAGVLPEPDERIQLIREMFRTMEIAPVLVPHFEFLDAQDLVPTRDTRARRDIKKIITLIKASALLHQRQRYWVTDKKGQEYVVADARDLMLVYDIALDNILAASQGLGPKDLEKFRKLPMYVPDDGRSTFTNEDVSNWLGLKSSASARVFMNRLVREGLVVQHYNPVERNKSEYKLRSLFVSSDNITRDKLQAILDEVPESMLEDWMGKNKLKEAERNSVSVDKFKTHLNLLEGNTTRNSRNKGEITANSKDSNANYANYGSCAQVGSCLEKIAVACEANHCNSLDPLRNYGEQLPVISVIKPSNPSECRNQEKITAITDVNGYVQKIFLEHQEYMLKQIKEHTQKPILYKDLFDKTMRINTQENKEAFETMIQILKNNMDLFEPKPGVYQKL